VGHAAPCRGGKTTWSVPPQALAAGPSSTSRRVSCCVASLANFLWSPPVQVACDA
jgi:hypothetical protein